MKVDEVLRRKGGRILSVRMSEPLETAARLLRRENVGALAVKDVCGTEGEVVIGMFSERDIVRAIADHGPSALKKPVWTMMSWTVISCAPESGIDEVLELMERHHIRHVPVMEERHLIGVISIRDVLGLRVQGP